MRILVFIATNQGNLYTISATSPHKTFSNNFSQNKRILTLIYHFVLISFIKAVTKINLRIMIKVLSVLCVKHLQTLFSPA